MVTEPSERDRVRSALTACFTTTIWPFRLQLQSTTPSVSLFFSLVVKPAWTLYRRRLKALKAYHIKSLQKILGLHWWHKVTHSRWDTKNGQCSLYGTCCHATSAEMGWPSYSDAVQLAPMSCSIVWTPGSSMDCQPQRFSDQVKATMRKCSAACDQLEVLAADREVWWDTCEEGLVAFDINYDQEGEDRHARRHTSTSIAASGRRCHICGRICASEFGLRTHLRRHCPSLTCYSTTSSSFATDISKQANTVIL